MLMTEMEELGLVMFEFQHKPLEEAKDDTIHLLKSSTVGFLVRGLCNDSSC